MKLLAVVSVLLLAGVAFLVRGGARAGAVDSRADAESLYRLRLVELSLAAGHVPRRDRFVAPPVGSVVPWPPLYHGLLARVARARWAQPGRHVALRGVDAQLLRRWVGRATPLGFAVAVLLAAATARAFVREGTRAGPAPGAAIAVFVAAALAALHPAAVELGGAQRVAPDGWALAAGLAGVLAAMGALRPSDRVDGLSFALGGGLLAGLGALLSPATFGAAAGAVVALVVRSRRSDAERAGDARRAAVLFCVTAGIVCGLARWGVAPALAEAEAVSAEAGLSRAFLLLAIVPLVFGFLRVDGVGAVLCTLASAVAIVALAAPLGATEWLRVELARHAPVGWPGVDEVPGGAWTLACVLALPLALAAVWTRLEPARRALLASVVAFGAAEVLLGPGPGPGLLLAWILSAAAVVSVAARPARVLAVVCVVVVVAWEPLRSQPVAAAPGGAVAARDRARATALEWLRTSTPSPAPWNSALAVPAWAVLAPPEWDGAIAALARRPVVESGLVVGGRRPSGWAWSTLFTTEPGALIAAMDTSRARYLVVPAGEREAPDATNFARLARGEALAGLECVWVSERPADVHSGARAAEASVGSAGVAPLAAVSIWMRRGPAGS